MTYDPKRKREELGDLYCISSVLFDENSNLNGLFYRNTTNYVDVNLDNVDVNLDSQVYL